MMTIRLTRRLWGVLLLATALCQSGCKRAEKPIDVIDSNIQATSFRDLSPKQYLKTVLSRYRGAASYRDSARVLLSYDSGGKQETQVAPISLWYDQNSLYVEAYDTRISSDRSALTAWVRDPATHDFDSQVLRTAPISGRPTLKALLADPVLRNLVAAGLAGPPPQLEWLFAAEPMKLLFHEQNRIQFVAPQSIGGRACTCVQVDADGDQYVFYIDQRHGLIRRVDLPAIETMSESGRLQVMTLRLEFVDATFDAPSAPPPVEPLPENPRYVQRLGTLPADSPSSQ